MTHTSALTHVTPGEAALVLRFSEETVRRHLRNGELRGVKLGGGRCARWRVPASELDRFLQPAVDDPRP